jgi:LmbE family N-acetylglucosaminyl deacetylase
MDPLGERLLVVSPHCDDAVFSLGAVLHRHVRSGGTVTVLTALAGDPTDTSPAGPWDAEAGFRTAGEATRVRRAEDEAACSMIGASAVHHDEVDEQYARRRPLACLVEEVLRRSGDHDEVLLPGHPLRHQDHRAVRDALLPALRVHRPVRLYAEQPYTALRPSLSTAGDERWTAVSAERSDLLAKARAAARYRTQLGLLGKDLRCRAAGPSMALLLLLLRASRDPGEQVTQRLR